MDATDRSILYAGLIDTAHRRLRFLRVQHQRAAFTPDRSHCARRVCRLERTFTWLLRRAPADVLEDLVDFSPKYSGRVFDAILWAEQILAGSPPA